MKKILLLLVGLGLIGAAVGFYMFNKPLDSVASMKTFSQVQAADLLMAFEDDETKANAEYLDKVLEVTGTVEKIEYTDDKTTVYLDAENPMSSIIFQLEKADHTIEKGQSVRLKGICTGYLMDVVMVRGVKI